ALAGPPVMASPEVLPLRRAATVSVVLPVVPGTNVTATGRRFTVYRLDRQSGVLSVVGDAMPVTPTADPSRAVAISLPDLGAFAVGVSGNSPPVATVTAVNVVSGATSATIVYDVADGDADLVLPVAQYSTATGLWKPCSLFGGRPPARVSSGTGR